MLTRADTRSWHHCLTAVWLLATMCGLASCAKNATDTKRSGELPKIGDIKPRLPLDLPQGPQDSSPKVQVRITHLVLPVKPTLHKAWAFARSGGIEPPMTELWAANGLNVCVVHIDALKEFVGLIPKPVRVGQRQMQISNQSKAVDPITSSRVGRTQRLILTLPGDKTENLKLQRGRGRFLIEAQPQPDGAVLIFMTPQYHRPRATIRPRSRSEKQRDGDVFEQLRLQARLAPDHVLLVGRVQRFVVEPEAPPTSQPATSQPATTQPAASQPAEQAETLPPIQPIPEQNLGRLIFGACNRQRPAHELLAIFIDQKP